MDSGFTWSVIVRVPCGKTISHFVASIEFRKLNATVQLNNDYTLNNCLFSSKFRRWFRSEVNSVFL